jgi:hypothetical protein
VATAGADDVERVCALPFRLDRVAKQVVDRAAVDHVDESTQCASRFRPTESRLGNGDCVVGPPARASAFDTIAAAAAAAASGTAAVAGATATAAVAATATAAAAAAAATGPDRTDEVGAHFPRASLFCNIEMLRTPLLHVGAKMWFQ